MMVVKQAMEKGMLDDITSEDSDGLRRCMFCLDSSMIGDIMARFLKEMKDESSLNVVMLANGDSQLASMLLEKTESLQSQPVINGMATVDAFMRYVGQHREVNYDHHGFEARYLGRIDWRDMNMNLDA